jgi:hypothetical protein
MYLSLSLNERSSMKGCSFLKHEHVGSHYLGIAPNAMGHLSGLVGLLLWNLFACAKLVVEPLEDSLLQDSTFGETLSEVSLEPLVLGQDDDWHFLFNLLAVNSNQTNQDLIADVNYCFKLNADNLVLLERTKYLAVVSDELVSVDIQTGQDEFGDQLPASVVGELFLQEQLLDQVQIILIHARHLLYSRTVK